MKKVLLVLAILVVLAAGVFFALPMLNTLTQPATDNVNAVSSANENLSENNANENGNTAVSNEPGGATYSETITNINEQKENRGTAQGASGVASPEPVVEKTLNMDYIVGQGQTSVPMVDVEKIRARAYEFSRYLLYFDDIPERRAALTSFLASDADTSNMTTLGRLLGYETDVDGIHKFREPTIHEIIVESGAVPYSDSLIVVKVVASEEGVSVDEAKGVNGPKRGSIYTIVFDIEMNVMAVDPA